MIPISIACFIMQFLFRSYPFHTSNAYDGKPNGINGKEKIYCVSILFIKFFIYLVLYCRLFSNMGFSDIEKFGIGF